MLARQATARGTKRSSCWQMLAAQTALVADGVMGPGGGMGLWCVLRTGNVQAQCGVRIDGA